MGNVKTASTAAVDADMPMVATQAGTAEADAPVSAQALAEALDPQLVARLAAQARAQGVSLLGRDGLLQQLTKRFLEAAVDAEMDEHLGYGKHDAAGRNGANSRNGKRAETLLTEVGPVGIEVPRDRDGSFTPAIVAKRQRRFGGIDDLVISLTAKGLTTGAVAAHLAEVYGAEVSKDHISTITDRVLDTIGEWQNRPLDSVYPVVFIDCIHGLHPREDPRRAGRQPAHLRRPRGDRRRRPRHPRVVGPATAVRAPSTHSWLRVLTELRNRGWPTCASWSATA